MSVDPPRKRVKAFSVHGLPRELVQSADAQMKALGITEWRKKLIAGMLQLIQLGVLPPQFLRFVCAEGAAAKVGGTLYRDPKVLLADLRAALAPLFQESPVRGGSDS